MANAFIGIDPGVSGAMALISRTDICVQDWVDGPTVSSVFLDWVLDYEIKLVALELVGSMPKQGVASTFKFGTNYGWWQGILDALRMPYQLVRPQEWQKGIGVAKKSAPDDKPSLLVARRLFPSVDLHLKKHHGRADALLIADWARRRYDGD